jgi:hypothetical protein
MIDTSGSRNGAHADGRSLCVGQKKRRGPVTSTPERASKEAATDPANLKPEISTRGGGVAIRTATFLISIGACVSNESPHGAALMARSSPFKYASLCSR